MHTCLPADMPVRVCPVAALELTYYLDGLQFMQCSPAYLPSPPPSGGPDIVTTLVVVDDSRHMRRRIVETLADVSASLMIFEAHDIASALACFARHEPHIVVLDISLPGTPELTNGIDLLGWITHHLPQTHVIMLTNMADPAYRVASFAQGAAAFLDKSREFEKLPGVVTTWATMRHTL